MPLSSSAVTVHDVLLDIIADFNTPNDNQVALNQSMDALQQGGNADQLQLWNQNAKSSSSAAFALGAFTMSNGGLNYVGGVNSLDMKVDPGGNFFMFAASSTNATLTKASSGLTLDDNIYSQARDSVSLRLGASAKK